MPVVHVESLNGARRRKRRYGAVLSIEDPGFRNGLRFHKTPQPHHMVLLFEDVDRDLRPAIAAASREQIEAGLIFGRLHTGVDLLVHCYAGIARSSAMALAIIADRDGPGAEETSVATLLSVRPQSVPNLHVLDLADDILGRGGSLRRAWENAEIGNGACKWYRSRKEEMLQQNPGLFAKGLPEGVTGIKTFPAPDGRRLSR